MESLTHDLENLENEIQAIVKENEAIISVLNKYKESKQPILKKVYKIYPKPLAPDSTEIQPYSFECQTIELKSTKSELFFQWKVPSTQEKPQEVDPDKLLYGENKALMDMNCEGFEDLVRINAQSSVCMRYLTLLRESASLKFGMKFKNNFQIIQNLLKIMLNDMQKEGEDVDSNQKLIQAKLDELNNQILQIFHTGIVFNEMYNGRLEIDSEILNGYMKESLKNMIPASNSFSFTFINKFQGIDSQGVQWFRNTVAGKGTTLIIVQTQDNYVFGAFLKEKFLDKNFGNNFGGILGFPPNIKNQNDPFKVYGKLDNFLFSFGKKGNPSPIKLIVEEGQTFPQPNCNSGLHVDPILSI